MKRKYKCKSGELKRNLQNQTEQKNRGRPKGSFKKVKPNMLKSGDHHQREYAHNQSEDARNLRRSQRDIEKRNISNKIQGVKGPFEPEKIVNDVLCSKGSFFVVKWKRSDELSAINYDCALKTMPHLVAEYSRLIQSQCEFGEADNKRYDARIDWDELFSTTMGSSPSPLEEDSFMERFRSKAAEQSMRMYAPCPPIVKLEVPEDPPSPQPLVGGADPPCEAEINVARRLREKLAAQSIDVRFDVGDGMQPTAVKLEVKPEPLE